jgi:hypothetical protein
VSPEGAKADHAICGGRREQVTPRRAEALRCPPADARGHRIRELGTREALPVESIPDRLDRFRRLVEGNPGQFVPDGARLAEDYPHRRHPHWELVRRQQVKGAARSPHLHEFAPLPDGRSKIRQPDVDPSRNRQLSRGHDLGLDTAEI